jgi:hypothetical protein
MKMTTYHRPLVFDQRVPNRIQNSELRIQNAGIRRGDSGVSGLAFSELGFRIARQGERPRGYLEEAAAAFEKGELRFLPSTNRSQ